nr:hypothetical protein GCM10020063_006240 [Dactylosporangium thailandense]
MNPDNVRSHSDRVLYSAIGVFILLYFAYATVGGAVFIDTSANYTHPWWRWLVGPMIALAVIAYDRAVVGRVATNFDDLENEDPSRLVKRRTVGLYLGRFVLALLVAVVITEPLMLDRYKGEIDNYLNDKQNVAAEQARSAGAIKGYEDEKARIDTQNTADDDAVNKLTKSATDKRSEAADIYKQALADSEGDGVTHKSGCPAGGYCDSLVKRSNQLRDEAKQLDDEAAALRQQQQAGRDSRAARKRELDGLIAKAQDENLQVIKANSGFGARTAAMWHLIVSDFLGVGVFYLGTALLLIALDCAAIGLKLVSHGNAYERAEARQSREQELMSRVRHKRRVETVQKAEDAYGEVASEIVTDSIRGAADERRLRREAAREAREHLRTTLHDTMHVGADGKPSRNGRVRQRTAPVSTSPWPAPEHGFTDPDGDDDPDTTGDDGTTRGWAYQPR